MNQMCRNNSCGRKTKRWTLCVFYGILNIACVNAWIIHVHNASKKNEQLIRKNFLIKLSEELMLPWMQKRLLIPTISSELRTTIQTIVGKEEPQEGETAGTAKPERRTICYICPSKKRRMTTTFCNVCLKAFCKEHRAQLYTNCAK